jgi:hypothetical protein
MADKKHTTGKPKPLHTVCSGEVLITLSERQTNSGYCYRDMTLSREWSNQTTLRRAHGSTFYEKHEEDLVKAIRECDPGQQHHAHRPLVHPHAEQLVHARRQPARLHLLGVSATTPPW